MSLLTETRRLDMNRHLGTELDGISLLELSDDEVTDLRMLLAERGVVVVRDQPMTVEEQIEFGRRLGPLHIHPAYADKTHPEGLRIHTDENSKYTAGDGWHTDVSCDLEPPGISVLRIETTPSTGGDTAFSSMYRAYDTLSGSMQNFLASLEAVHSGDLPYRGVYGSTSSKEYPRNTHPVIRTHPDTGRRALYVNTGFTDYIKGLSRAESKGLLSILFDHIAKGVEFQIRVRWEPNTVTLWDNRCVQHHASWDYFPETRSGWRITTKGEQPFLAAS